MPVTASKPGIVAFKDDVYTVNSNGAVFKYLSGNSWKVIGGNANVTQLAATATSAYIYDPQNDIRAVKASDYTTKVIDRSPERMTIAASAKFVYKLHVDQNRIYQYSSKDWNLVDDGVQAIAIAVDEDDTLYQLHLDGRISKYLGSEGWQEIDSTPNVQSILAGGGKVYKIHKDGAVYVHVEDYDWDRIDKSDTVQVYAGPAGLFQKRRDGSVWQYDNSSAKTWTSINPATTLGIDIAVGNAVYLTASNNIIYKYNSQPNSWTRIN